MVVFLLAPAGNYTPDFAFVKWFFVKCSVSENWNPAADFSAACFDL